MLLRDYIPEMIRIAGQRMGIDPPLAAKRFNDVQVKTKVIQEFMRGTDDLVRERTEITDTGVNPTEQAVGVLWSFVGERDYSMDIDVRGAVNTWFVNFECVGNNFQQATAIADTILEVMVEHGSIVQMYSRYDEPFDPDQEARGYRSHNIACAMNGMTIDIREVERVEVDA